MSIKARIIGLLIAPLFYLIFRIRNLFTYDKEDKSLYNGFKYCTKIALKGY